MTKFDIYSLILCVIVFVMLVSVFSYMLTILIKQTLKHVNAGLEDENLIKEFTNAKKPNKFLKWVNGILNGLLCLIVGAIFVSTLYISCTQNTFFENVPTYRVVITSSMEEKHKDNKYLIENNLNNQISAFDLIITYKIPDEEDLKLYDIVVYEVDGILVVHRIVGIEEPNQYHPNERHFLLQGDAVGKPDRFPVKYSQMKGIYKNQKIPFIGSFILFMQSPAGWLCILLVVGSMILTPILEKKLLNARKNRYLLLTQQEEVVATEDEVESVSPAFANFGPTKTFKERLMIASEEMQNRYNTVTELLSRIENVRLIESKTQETYKSKLNCIARIFFKGKTINVALGLVPNDYENSKYKFIDLSNKEKYKNYPMCLRLTSDRQTRWTCELILDLAKKNGLNILEKPVKFFGTKVARKTFEEKLKLSTLANERFSSIKDTVERIDGVRRIESKNQVTYKFKNIPVVRFMIRGKTLNSCIGLVPNEYENTKYKFIDLSNKAKYKNYPMCVKASSDRQARWTCELILDLAKKNGLNILEKPVKLTDLKVKKKTFKQKLKLSSLAKERFINIKNYIEGIEGIRKIESKYHITYKLKNLAVVKFMVKGKTLNAYLGLEPNDFLGTKYKFIDVSNVKKYSSYKMRVKVSSDRQVKWVKELIQKIVQK